MAAQEIIQVGTGDLNFRSVMTDDADIPARASADRSRRRIGVTWWISKAAFAQSEILQGLAALRGALHGRFYQLIGETRVGLDPFPQNFHHPATIERAAFTRAADSHAQNIRPNAFSRSGGSPDNETKVLRPLLDRFINRLQKLGISSCGNGRVQRQLALNHLGGG